MKALALALAAALRAPAPAMAPEPHARDRHRRPYGAVEPHRPAADQPDRRGAQGRRRIQAASGGYYRIDIISDGTQEIAVEGPGLFRAVWINEVVINDLEVRPLGLNSIEFDDEGTVSLSFVAITPGQYDIRIRGTTGDSQRAAFVIQ